MKLRSRSHEVFRLLVESYCHTGEPVSSRALAAARHERVSSATIRNIMGELEDLGLIYSPHTSAGRVPTEAGFRYFVNALDKIGSVRADDKANIEHSVIPSGRSIAEVIETTASTLSNLSNGLGLMFTAPTDPVLKHIDLTPLDQGRALAVLVSSKGQVENRVIDMPTHIGAAVLHEATNYLNAHLKGRTLRDARLKIQAEFEAERLKLNALAAQAVKAGLALLEFTQPSISYVVRGQSNLLRAVQALPDLERLQTLFSALEAKEGLLTLLDEVIEAQGVQTYIGSESEAFNLSEHAIILAPCHNPYTRAVGAIGVIGPLRLDYARVIPMVEYTARQISRTLG